MGTISNIGIIGLGKMGGNLGLQAIDKGYTVFGYDPKPLSEEYKNYGLHGTASLAELVSKLPSPRVILIYVGAGPIIDKILDELSPLLTTGDVVLDAGNSYWGDSIRRHQKLSKSGIHFVDCGTSGGVSGARNGACFMVGGDNEAIALVEPLLKSLAVSDGYVHAGKPGSGHFTKLVHNGIEFGMLQAIGEGMDLLENFHHDLDMKGILKCWNHGSVVRSWLMELMEAQYNEQSGFDKVPGYIEDTGEVNWLVNDALHMEVPIPVISQSVMQLFTSRDQTKTWARAIAMMRHGFGGHPFGEDTYLQKFRKTSQVDGFPKEIL